METTWRDVRHALRNLTRTPGFAVVAICVLALGIGANVAMFSVLHSVALRPLPYHEPERLVRLWPSHNFNITLVDMVKQGLPSVRSASGLSLWSLTLTGEGEPEQLDAAYVGTNHFDMLGVPPALGRGFRPEEFEHGRSDVIVLSYDFWQRRFGGDPSIVGRRLRIEGRDHGTREVVGVMPRDYREIRGEPDVWAPLSLPAGRTFVNDSTWYVNWVVGRLAPGASLAGANEEMRTVARQLRQDHPRFFEEEVVATAEIEPLHETIVGDVKGTLWLMLGAVGLVLLIACANLANLLLARAAGRERDAALRVALGASRGRLVRHGLTEAAILSLLGLGAALPLAQALAAYLQSNAPADLPRAEAIGLDLVVLGFAFGLSAICAAAIGLIPALRAGGDRIQERLRAGGRWSPGGGSHRLSRSLVAGEMAVVMVLVTAGSLVLKGFAGLRATDPGFRPDEVMVVEAVVPLGPEEGGVTELAFHEGAIERLRGMTGVEAVGAIHLLPLTPDNWSFPYLAEGHEPDPDRPLPSANFRIVMGDYFRTVGIPLLSGRALADADRAGAPPVGLINRAMAAELWPGEDPIGKEIKVFGNLPFTVVGVVGDVRQHRLEGKPRPEMYLPKAQWRWAVSRMYLMVHTRGAPPGADALRQAVWSVDPGVPIPSVRPLERVVAASVADARFFAALLAGFGILGLVMGALGVYGVAAHVTRTRLPDYGIRLALGAAPRSVIRQVLADGLRPVALGLGLGLVGSLAAARLLGGLLYGVAPGDPTVYAAAAALLVTAGALATYVPALRAGRSDPVQVLRSE